MMTSPSAAGRLTVITGPSGVGKGTLVAALLKRHPRIWLSVSATTRAPRSGEVDGVSYFFLARERFADQVAAGGLLEWAEFAGNCYGTPREPVERHLAEGRPVLLEIELEGARQVRHSFPGGVQIFLKPPSFAELERRIRGRGTDGEEAIVRRLERAQVELKAEGEFDAVLVNGDLDQALNELEGLMGLG
ncbi:guanylate kinase [Cyanobium sp. Morenito 9A2]|uniref:guanylate kinase n=1 Tax=Cyanobium sp. Morenito 9A2 TaxID=2823718 RepID=UPI0020CC7D2E|nr:guanylate kinase [Cyanobium sp. Morenito 9A2]MCP9848301.1 guanylate kinase [Cyanobium sp. Morenito 9A2]